MAFTHELQGECRFDGAVVYGDRLMPSRPISEAIRLRRTAEDVATASVQLISPTRAAPRRDSHRNGSVAESAYVHSSQLYIAQDRPDYFSDTDTGMQKIRASRGAEANRRRDR
jgi:hypothetical protein